MNFLFLTHRFDDEKCVIMNAGLKQNVTDIYTYSFKSCHYAYETRFIFNESRPTKFRDGGARERERRY